jgi:hypothetical protein
MKLRIKEEYIEYSVGGTGLKKIRLQDIPEAQYNRYYNLFPGFFEVIEEEKKTKKVASKSKKKDDKNNEGNKSIDLFNTDGESDTK